MWKEKVHCMQDKVFVRWNGLLFALPLTVNGTLFCDVVTFYGWLVGWLVGSHYFSHD